MKEWFFAKKVMFKSYSIRWNLHVIKKGDSILAGWK